MTWQDRITRAKKRGGFNINDKRHAEKWNSCAVGEKLNLANDRKISRLEVELNLPSEWISLGDDFAAAVYSDNVDLAQRLYEKIKKKRRIKI